MKPFEDIDMDLLLPQQPPFRFVDMLESYTEEDTVVHLTVGTGHMLMDGDELSAAGLLEHMAQASATRAGYRTRFVLNQPISIGYIGQVKKYSIARLPKNGERLTTTVHLVQDFFNVSMCDIEVRVGEELIAQATLKSAQAA
ncbi:MAG: hypothetical protein IJU21_05035 [Bacteroidales bacterium]|nr:hypothetical protein [Bacteroidales bacterium]